MEKLQAAIEEFFATENKTEAFLKLIKDIFAYLFAFIGAEI